MRYPWLFLLCFLLAPALANATDAFVSPTGSGASCTSVAPCGTILAASSVVDASSANAHIWVAPGYYQMPNFTTTMGNASHTITVICQASSTGVYVRGGCVMTPALGAALSTWWFINGVGNLIIDGLQLDGRGQDGSTWVGGIVNEATAGNPVTYQNNIVHHLAQVPTNVCNSNGGAGLNGDSFHSTATVTNMLNNLVHDIGSWQTGCNTVQGLYLASGGGGVIANNIVYDISGWCIIQWHDASNYKIVNNTTSKCVSGNIAIGSGEWYLGTLASGNNVGGAGSGGGVVTNAITATNSNVLHFTASATGLSNIQVGWSPYDETHTGSVGPICGNGQSGSSTLTVASVNVGAGTVTLTGGTSGTGLVCTQVPSADSIMFGPPSNNNYVAYNIAYDAPSGLYEYGLTGTSNTYTRNLTSLNSTAVQLQNGLTATTEVTSDPQFLDYISGGNGNNYHLASTSPARGAAAATNAQATDFEGNARPQGTAYDIGAYEYLTASPYFTTSAGTIGTTNAGRYSQLDITGNANGIDNSGGQIHLNNPLQSFYDKWIRLNDAGGDLEITNNQGVPIFAVTDTGSTRIGQYANTHKNLGATCFATNGLPALNGSGIAQTCRYIFVGAGSASGGTVVLTTDGNAASAHNCANMPINSSGTWSAQLHASDIGTRGRDWSWSMPSGAFFRDAGSISITSGAAVSTTDRGTVTGIAAAMTADTTNQCFHLAWTHPSSDSDLYNISAYIDIAEVSP